MKPTNSFSNVVLQYTAKDGVGNLYYGSGYDMVSNGTQYDLTAYKTEDNVVVVPLRILDPANSAFYTDYTLTIQSKEIASVLTIDQFVIEGQVGTTFEKGKLAFEVLMPYNRDLSGANPLVTNIRLTDTNSSHDWVTYGYNAHNYEPTWPNYDPADVTVDLTVTGENGETQVYEVTVRRAEAITKFDIPNATKTEIKWPNAYVAAGVTPYTGEAVMDGGEINIEVPRYAILSNANYLNGVVVDFDSELGDVQPTRLELYDTVLNTKTTIVSGVTSLDLRNATTPGRMVVIASYPGNDGGAKAFYDLTISEELSGSRATIADAAVESATIAGMEVAGTIDDDQIKVVVSDTMDLSNVHLNLRLPYGATAEILIGTTTHTQVATAALAEYNDVSFQNLDLRKPVTIKVTSESTDTIKTYTLTVDPSGKVGEPAKFSSVYLKNNSTGVVYEADAKGLDGVEMTFTVPRSTLTADLTGFTLYYSAPVGASLTYKTGATTYASLPRSGTALTGAHFGTNAVLPAPDYTSMATTEIVVKTFDNNAGAVNETKYIVGFKYNDWITENKLQSGKFALTSARDAKEVTSDITYTGTVKTVNTSTATVYGETGPLSVVEVEIPWLYWWKLYFLNPEPLMHMTLSDLGLPEGAALYIQTASGAAATRLYDINDPRWKTTTLQQIYDFTSMTTDTLQDTEIRIFVLNERGIYDLDTVPGNNGTIAEAALTNSANAGNVSAYYLVAKGASKRSAAGLNKLSIFDQKDDGKVIDAVIKNDAIVLNVPWSWARGDDTILSGLTDDTNAPKIRILYDAKPGNIMADMLTNGYFISDGFKDVDGNYSYSVADGDTFFRVSQKGDLYISNYQTGVGNVSEVGTFFVESETGATKYYSVEVNILPIQSGAEIKSFSVNGVAGVVSGDTIKVTLPYMSKYDDVAPVFTTSDMATVTFDDTGAEVISGKTLLDFTKTVNLTVKSEDGKATTKYKVIVEAPMQFSDVKPGSWYYDAVMEAAGLGIITGYSDGTFKPANPVTRADFVLMLTRAMGVTDAELNAYTNNPFMDVDITSYYAKAVAWASDKGYVTGYQNADFKPTKNITRQEAATIYCRVMGLAEVTSPAEADKYNDHGAIASWAAGYVYALKNAGVMSGHSDGTFTPQSNLTRAQTAQAMVNYYHKK